MQPGDIRMFYGGQPGDIPHVLWRAPDAAYTVKIVNVLSDVVLVQV